jgi:hypothetical protein
MILGVLTALAGCSGMYYNAMEKLGYHKRDLLVDRVQDARNAQEQAKEQFASALEQFSAVVGFEGGELERTYNRLKTEFERSELRAEAVHERIEDVEAVAIALFREWEGELGEYNNDRLRRLSRQKLDQTKARYETLIQAMRRAEGRIGPVLAALRDQVLFLKHNLNAQAVASLESELATVRTDVATLIEAMEASIREADEFIGAMTREE